MRDEIARQAVSTWGATAQADMLIEECAELIQAVQHWRRGRATNEQVASEIADVSIMLAQARFMFGAEAVDAAREAKVTRLVCRLEATERKRQANAPTTPPVKTGEG